MSNDLSREHENYFHLMNRFLLDFTLIIGFLIMGNLSSHTSQTISSFASIYDMVNTVNKSGCGLEYPGINCPLEVKPNKSSFKLGERVIITVKNNGVEPLTFPDASMGLLIANVATKENFGSFAAQVLTTLQPGQSKSIDWDQRRFDGTQADEGKYKVSVTTIPEQYSPPLTSYSYFQIREN
jgi:hypothetical protein